jgi:hypothetical protein
MGTVLARLALLLPRRQPGQVRLRRLLTEVMTETASGQRHEVRVEREPSATQTSMLVPSPSNQDTQPVGREPTAPTAAPPRQWRSFGLLRPRSRTASRPHQAWRMIRANWLVASAPWMAVVPGSCSGE